MGWNLEVQKFIRECAVKSRSFEQFCLELKKKSLFNRFFWQFSADTSARAWGQGGTEGVCLCVGPRSASFPWLRCGKLATRAGPVGGQERIVCRTASQCPAGCHDVGRCSVGATRASERAGNVGWPSQATSQAVRWTRGRFGGVARHERGGRCSAAKRRCLGSARQVAAACVGDSRWTGQAERWTEGQYWRWVVVCVSCWMRLAECGVALQNRKCVSGCGLFLSSSTFFFFSIVFELQVHLRGLCAQPPSLHLPPCYGLSALSGNNALARSVFFCNNWKRGSFSTISYSLLLSVGFTAWSCRSWDAACCSGRQ